LNSEDGCETDCDTVYGPESSGEKAGTQKEKPDSIGRKTGYGIRMESKQYGRMGDSPKPNFGNNHNISETQKTGLCFSLNSI
jgi:hypothetical protein